MPDVVQVAWVFQNGINKGFLTKTENTFVINAISVSNTRVEENYSIHGINSELISESNMGGGGNIGN